MAFNQEPGRTAIASRYQYGGAVFVLLIAANLLQGVRPSRRVLTVAAAVTAVVVGPEPGRPPAGARRRCTSRRC